jgi:hypothetical protein
MKNSKSLKNRKIISVLLLVFVGLLLVSSRADALINIVSTFIDMMGNDIYNIGNLNSTGVINNTGTIYAKDINATASINGTNIYQGGIKVPNGNDRFVVGDVDPDLVNEIDMGGKIIFVDEFYNALNTNWLITGTMAVNTADSILGGKNMTTGATSGNDAGITFGPSVTTTVQRINATKMRKFEAKILIVNLSRSVIVIGLGREAASVAFSAQNNGIFFNRTNNGNWFANTCDNNVCTMNDTTQIMNNATWNTYTIKSNMNGDYAEFYINGTLVSNLTTNLPIANKVAWVGYFIENNDGVADISAIDYLYFESARW